MLEFAYTGEVSHTPYQSFGSGYSRIRIGLPSWIWIRIEWDFLDPGPYFRNTDPDPGERKLVSKITKVTYLMFL